jgi:hypothetical protein
VDPQLSDLERVADLLGLELAQVLDLTVGSMAGEEGDTERRTFVAGLVGFGLGGIDLERLAAPGVERAWLETAESVSTALRAQLEVVPAENMLPLWVAHLHSLEVRLPAAAEQAGRAAYLTAVTLANVSRRSEAYRACALAIALGSAPVGALAMGLQARVHEVRGDVRSALAYQDQAVRLATGGQQAVHPARRAELHAHAGDDLLAMRDLEAAQRSLSGHSHDWYYVGPEDEVELGAYRGCVLASLGRHAEAANTLDWVLARMDPRKPLWRAQVAADRDAALAQIA